MGAASTPPRVEPTSFPEIWAIHAALVAKGLMPKVLEEVEQSLKTSVDWREPWKLLKPHVYPEKKTVDAEPMDEGVATDDDEENRKKPKKREKFPNEKKDPGDGIAASVGRAGTSTPRAGQEREKKEQPAGNGRTGSSTSRTPAVNKSRSFNSSSTRVRAPTPEPTLHVYEPPPEKGKSKDIKYRRIPYFPEGSRPGGAPPPGWQVKAIPGWTEPDESGRTMGLDERIRWLEDHWQDYIEIPIPKSVPRAATRHAPGEGWVLVAIGHLLAVGDSKWTKKHPTGHVPPRAVDIARAHRTPDKWSWKGWSRKGDAGPEEADLWGHDSPNCSRAGVPVVRLILNFKGEMVKRRAMWRHLPLPTRAHVLAVLKVAIDNMIAQDDAVQYERTARYPSCPAVIRPAVNRSCALMRTWYAKAERMGHTQQDRIDFGNEIEGYAVRYFEGSYDDRELTGRLADELERCLNERAGRAHARYGKPLIPSDEDAYAEAKHHWFTGEPGEPKKPYKDTGTEDDCPYIPFQTYFVADRGQANIALQKAHLIRHAAWEAKYLGKENPNRTASRSPTRDRGSGGRGSNRRGTERQAKDRVWSYREGRDDSGDEDRAGTRTPKGRKAGDRAEKTKKDAAGRGKTKASVPAKSSTISS